MKENVLSKMFYASGSYNDLSSLTQTEKSTGFLGVKPAEKNSKKPTELVND